MPIPGTRRLDRLEENLASADLELTADDLAEIDTAASQIVVEGARYPEAMQRLAVIHRALQTHGVDSDEPSVLHWGWSEMLDGLADRHGDKDR